MPTIIIIFQLIFWLFCFHSKGAIYSFNNPFLNLWQMSKNDLWIFTIWVQALIFNGNNLIGLQKGAVKFHNLPHMRFYNFLSVSQKKTRDKGKKCWKIEISWSGNRKKKRYKEEWSTTRHVVNHFTSKKYCTKWATCSTSFPHICVWLLWHHFHK